jgi:hypothetical protein
MRALLIFMLAWGLPSSAGAEKGGNPGHGNRSSASQPGGAGPLNALAEHSVLVKNAAARELASGPKSAPALEFKAVQAGESAPFRPATPHAEDLAGLFAPWKLRTSSDGEGEGEFARPYPRNCR